MINVGRLLDRKGLLIEYLEACAASLLADDRLANAERAALANGVTNAELDAARRFIDDAANSTEGG